ncbi:MAG: PP2C family protein-serine/threonine phosphatase [bacterium]
MIEPKIFYRKLDALLRKIGKEKTGKKFLFSILAELEASFGSDLHLTNGKLFQENQDEFVLLTSPGQPRSKQTVTKLSLASDAIQRVLQFGSYIYDQQVLAAAFGVDGKGEYAIPAAFTVIKNPEERWLFVFELHDGWVREEVEFCMNAVRAALNYRLFSDAVKNDLQQAAHIQQSLLPASAPAMRGFEMAARSQPAELVGGDLFDYLTFDDEMFGVAVGDASGHGLPAALLVRDVVTGLRMGMEKHMKIVATLKKLNRVIHRSTYSSLFVSLFYAEIESNGNIIYANAGHPMPLLIQGKNLQELKASSMILGALPEITLQRGFAYFEPGAVLLLFSDGIFERQDREGHQFGLERLKALAIQEQEKSAQGILDAMFNAVFEFGGGEKWEDDATLVVVKRLPVATS